MTISILIGSTLGFPVIHTPELDMDTYNFYVSEYNGKDTTSEDFDIFYDIPIENQVIWPTTLNFNHKTLKRLSTIQLMLVAVIPEDFNVKINHTVYSSQEVDDIDGDKMKSKVLVKFFNFKIQTADDIEKLGELFEEFSFKDLKNIKFKKYFDAIMRNEPILEKEIQKVPDSEEEYGPDDHYKVGNLVSSLNEAKYMLFVLQKSFSPRSNMDKLLEFPNLLNEVYQFDVNQNKSLANVPTRPILNYFTRHANMESDDKEPLVSRLVVSFSLGFPEEIEEKLQQFSHGIIFDKDTVMNNLYTEERRLLLI
jgi:hypothetical protein